MLIFLGFSKRSLGCRYLLLKNIPALCFVLYRNVDKQTLTNVVKMDAVT